MRGKKGSVKFVFSVFTLLTLIVFSPGRVIGETESLITYVIMPITNVMILPDTDPKTLPGSPSDTILVIATPGEYEPASFVIRPVNDIKAVKAEATVLKCGENFIPASNIDIKIVKCWYQAKGAWKTLNRLSYKKVLIPELLLNDDKLVKVDYKEEENYLRLIYQPGTPHQEEKYICISKKPDVENLDDPHNREIYSVAPEIGVCESNIKEDFSVKDSPVLLPVDISAGTNKQFWLTIKVPEEAKPGIYTGNINLSSPDGLLKTLTIRVKVLPFKLSEQRTYYDSSKEFTSSIFYRGELDLTGKGAVFGGMRDGGMHDFKSEEQLRAEFKNMYIHGVTKPMICLPYGMIADNDKLFREILRIRKDAGIIGPYYMVFDLAVNQQDESGLEDMKRKAKRLMKIANEYGISEFYFSGIDEASSELLLSQRPSYKAVREAGGKVMQTGFPSGTGRYKDALEDIRGLVDVYVCVGAPVREEADRWHSVNSKIWNNGNPYPVENPEINRRNYGLLSWKTGYDGVCVYAYQNENGGWNDFNDISRDGNYAYPTSDGVIDTIAWEGYREGIDDIKYATTLKLEIEKAKNGKDKEKERIAKEAEDYLENLDVSGDLDTIRMRIMDYILKIK